MAQDLEVNFVGFLKADPALGALVGTRIYSEFSPQPATAPTALQTAAPLYPRVVVQVVSASQEYHLGGPIGMVHARVQVSCLGRGPSGKADAVAVALAVKNSQGGNPTGPKLDGFHGTMGDMNVQKAALTDRRRSAEGPTHADETPVRRIDLDFAITYYE